MKALELEDLRRSFGGREVVHGLSLEVCLGETVALLGPNGSGKTTTAKMASTLLLPDAGSVRICGVDALRDVRAARERVSLLLGGERGFYARASAEDNLRFFSALSGSCLRGLDERVGDALRRVGLWERRGDAVESFSRGMKQRLHIARALLSRPQLVILDEPTCGLDVENARNVQDLVMELRSSGTGILLTTHSMREAEVLSDRVHIICEGTSIASGTVEELAKGLRMGAVVCFNASRLDMSDVRLLEGVEDVRMVSVTQKAGSWDIDVGIDAAGRGDALAKGCHSFGWRLMGTRPATLEETYLALLGASRREGVS